MGVYDVPDYIGPYIWTPVIFSWDNDASTYTTYDGGTFRGLIGGALKDHTIDARGLAMYIDPEGNSGILSGDLTGSYHPEHEYNDYRMFYLDGAWEPTVMASGLPVSPLSGMSRVQRWGDVGYVSVSTPGSFSAGGSITESDSEGRGYSISGQDWGIWEAITGGTYSGTTSDSWEQFREEIGSDYITGSQTTGAQWSDERVAGSTLGYGADLAAASTWISVGETLGTFDPNALTWQAVQIGAWIETDRFLAMTQTAEGQAKLAQLNIPYAEVGRATLTGSGNNFTDLTMADTIFFAYSNG